MSCETDYALASDDGYFSVYNVLSSARPLLSHVTMKSCRLLPLLPYSNRTIIDACF